jgi:hypothetical protein
LHVTRTLALILGGAMFATACSTTTADNEAPLSVEGASGPAAGTTGETALRPAAAKAAPVAPRYREVTIPSGTTLALRMTSAVASDTSAVEDAVSAELTQDVTIDGREVLPVGAIVAGEVTGVDDAGRVRGRARVAFRFHTVTTGGNQYEMQTASISRTASATKGEDATKVGIGAGAGAIIGGLLGGKDGAAKGAAVGGGAGAGVVLATKGNAIRLGPGADIRTTLTAPLTVRVRTS